MNLNLGSAAPTNEQHQQHIAEAEHDVDEVSAYTDSADEWEAPPRALEEGEEQQSTAIRCRSIAVDDEVERELAGEEISIVFTLPSNKVVRHQFFMGQTIERVKMLLEELEGCPYLTTKLFLQDKLLLDPLSLNDLPFQAGVDNAVRVEVSA